MKFLILLLAIVPIYATLDVTGDLLDLEYSTLDHVRERRQSGNYRTLNQAPPQIHQLLEAQNSRRPLIPVPSQPIPKLGPSQPIQPQQLSQTQVSQYKPQVQFSSGVQQPDYRAIQSSTGGQYQRPYAQQPQYRPQPQGQNYNQQQQQNYNQQQQQNYNPQQPQYSTKLPPHLQQLLQYQSNLANSIPRRA